MTLQQAIVDPETAADWRSTEDKNAFVLTLIEPHFPFPEAYEHIEIACIITSKNSAGESAQGTEDRSPTSTSISSASNLHWEAANVSFLITETETSLEQTNDGSQNQEQRAIRSLASEYQVRANHRDVPRLSTWLTDLRAESSVVPSSPRRIPIQMRRNDRQPDVVNMEVEVDGKTSVLQNTTNDYLDILTQERLSEDLDIDSGSHQTEDPSSVGAVEDGGLGSAQACARAEYSNVLLSYRAV